MTDRTRIILEDLEAVRENLLALSDDIWLSIDHNDPDALEEGVAFKRTYNEKLAAFDSLATELSVLVQQFTSVNLEAEEQTGGDSESENRRIIQELDCEEPHGLEGRLHLQTAPRLHSSGARHDRHHDVEAAV